MKKTGEMLKKAREDKRLSLHEVALFLKINSRVLQAIEDGDQSQLPARTFLRGFIQSYAKFLKLDAQTVLQIFTEETSPPQAAVPVPAIPINSVQIDKTLENTDEDEIDFAETKQAATSEKTEIDVISLEKSILTQSQVAQDKLGIKTIAVSVVGLLLVGVLYFANNVVKKYQREAQVDPVNTTATITESPNSEPVKDVGAPVTSTPVALPQATGRISTPEGGNATIPSPAVAPAPTVPTSAPVNPAQTSVVNVPNSVQPNSGATGSSFIAPITLPQPKITAKPKLPEASEIKPIEKPVVAQKPIATPPVTPPVATKPVENPVEKPATIPSVPPVAATNPSEKKEILPEGKLIEVIVEAKDAVEIEYSSSKTNPQKMVLKAEQIHTFKSRSGVRLKISNGGAVNIIMNGRDLGVPGAVGQPVQVTY